MPGGVFIAIGIAAIAIAYAVSRAIARAEFRRAVRERLFAYGDVVEIPQEMRSSGPKGAAGGGAASGKDRPTFTLTHRGGSRP